MDAPEDHSAGPQVGDQLEVVIADHAFGGEGVARVDGFVVFVPFVAAGETVSVEIVERKRDFARARLLQVLTPSPERTTPRCRHFGECGGCQYQHIAYEAQLRIKHTQVQAIFQRIAGLPTEVIVPVVSCPQPYGYRNRIMVRRQWNKPEQRVVVGFLRHDSRLVVEVERCEIAEPLLNEQLQLVRKDPPPRNAPKAVLRMMPDDWQLHRDSFFQNNFHMLPELVATVRHCLSDSGARHLVDAYCGIGFFGLQLADLVDSFVGVEIDTQAIRSAKANATQRGVSNGEFVLGKTEELLDGLLQRFTAAKTAVILDPPRVGCHAAGLTALARSAPAQIIYVSCHPATLARDIKVLCDEGGYVLHQVTPLDMFPQTQHIECVADLRLKKTG
ncbi:MAG: class I SAM-dependent RNA methyltransferase [Pedosphaera sp.]|nr:class I SAM-dependent RNA methyltransferase [Pedosphaera sp.]MSU43794.1 class I SAM-dependent RNA methyltransferase [Pedosphaera sp.]